MGTVMLISPVIQKFESWHLDVFFCSEVELWVGLQNDKGQSYCQNSPSSVWLNTEQFSVWIVIEKNDSKFLHGQSERNKTYEKFGVSQENQTYWRALSFYQTKVWRWSFIVCCTFQVMTSKTTSWRRRSWSLKFKTWDQWLVFCQTNYSINKLLN